MTIPRATARLQFNRAFTFDDAEAILPYLSTLGISHIYASPILAATPGSMHGYDVIDPTEINPELGGYAALSRLSLALRRHGMGMILDIVPNHMAASAANPWWWDVLQWGMSSRYADYFDIDWHDPDPELRGKVLLPVLGGTLAECLERSEFRLDVDPVSGSFVLGYFDHRFPIDPRHYDKILASGGEVWSRLAQAFQNWRPEQPAAAVMDDLHKLRVLLIDQIRISRPSERHDLLAGFDPSFPMGRSRLSRLIAQQNYRLVHWREAASRINWRRFFDINSLVALRIDRAPVFDDYHRLIFDLVRDGIVDGLRVDHVDGLAEPAAYCRRLREALSKSHPEGAGAPYLLVEKILESDEQLPRDWAVDGTTGYDFMDQVAAVLHDPRGESGLSALWQRVSGDDRTCSEVVREARREILDRLFPRQLRGIMALVLDAAPELARATADRAMVELLAAFHRYRLYGDGNGFSAEERQLLEAMRQSAEMYLDEAERSALGTICQVLVAPENAEARSRFQQLSATLTAKAVEDTAFYRYGRLISRNEVGSNPGRLAITPAMFHGYCAARRDHLPTAMLATATHDHKRGEDARVRLAVLSEIPDEWSGFVGKWLAERSAPPQAIQMMIFQGIIGAWPLDLRPDDADGVGRLLERLVQWLVKALREAKQQTSWDHPDEAFETACRDFLAGLLTANPEFLTDLHRLIERISPAGALNGLAQVMLRLTTPGVPDLYQGREFWDFSLVDPDNREPVDFAARSRALMDESPITELLLHWRDGRIKQALIARLLQFRKVHSELFLRGNYEPLSFTGSGADHLLGHVRALDGEALLVVVPRLSAGIVDKGLTIPTGAFEAAVAQWPRSLAGRLGKAQDVLLSGPRTLEGGEGLDVPALLREFPLAAIHFHS